MTCEGCSRIGECYGDKVPYVMPKACPGYTWDENDDAHDRENDR